MTGQSTQNNYQAKVNFYHETLGTRNVGEVFCVTDTQAAQKLEQMGYIQKMDSQVHGEMMKAEQEQQAKQQEYGQKQAKDNEQAGIAAHDQHIQSLQQTQQINQARQQATQQSSSNQQMSQADQAMVHDKSQEFQPSATTNAQTKAQVAQAKAAKAKATDSYENK